MRQGGKITLFWEYMHTSTSKRVESLDQQVIRHLLCPWGETAHLWPCGSIHCCRGPTLGRLGDHTGGSLIGRWLGHKGVYPVGEKTEEGEEEKDEQHILRAGGREGALRWTFTDAGCDYFLISQLYLSLDDYGSLVFQTLQWHLVSPGKQRTGRKVSSSKPVRTSLTVHTRTRMHARAICSRRTSHVSCHVS